MLLYIVFSYTTFVGRKTPLRVHSSKRKSLIIVCKVRYIASCHCLHSHFRSSRASASYVRCMSAYGTSNVKGEHVRFLVYVLVSQIIFRCVLVSQILRPFSMSVLVSQIICS